MLQIASNPGEVTTLCFSCGATPPWRSTRLYALRTFLTALRISVAKLLSKSWPYSEPGYSLPWSPYLDIPGKKVSYFRCSQVEISVFTIVRSNFCCDTWSWRRGKEWFFLLIIQNMDCHFVTHASNYEYKGYCLLVSLFSMSAHWRARSENMNVRRQKQKIRFVNSGNIRLSYLKYLDKDFM